MRITDIHVEHYALWRNLHLQLPASGMGVLYGPNEAGKTTLLKFIRAIFYGFAPQAHLADRRAARQELTRTGPSQWSGSLELDCDGRGYRIRRVAEPHTRGAVTVEGPEGKYLAADQLNVLLNGVDEKLFEQVFAVGLREIQELSTLHDEEVAQHIYGLTLGPEGRQLLHFWEQLRSERERILDLPAEAGELATLFEQHGRISAELQAADASRADYLELSAHRQQLEQDIEDVKERQTGLHSQLRGHLFLDRVAGPWNRVRACETEIAKLPVVNNFPERGVERLDALERDLADAAAARDALVSEAKQIQQQVSSLKPVREFEAHAPSIQGLLDQREWISQIERDSATKQADAERLKGNLDARLEELGPPWTAKRLETLDTSPQAHFRLANLARSFRSALSRRARNKRVCQRHEATCKEQSDALRNQLEILGGGTLEESLDSARQRLSELENVAQLKLRESELQQRQYGIDEQRERLESRLVLPNWIYLVLGGFGVAGIALTGLGLVHGVRTSSLVGAIYVLLGVTCGLLAWALRNHFEKEVHDRVTNLDAEADANLNELRETRDRIAELTASNPEDDVDSQHPVDGSDLHDEVSGDSPASAETVLIKATMHRIADLDQLRGVKQRILETQRKLTKRRQHQQLCEREVGTARQSWQALLAQLGFPQNLRIEEAFTAWKSVIETAEVIRLRDASVRECNHFRSIAQGHRTRIEELGRQILPQGKDSGQPLKVLQELETRLRSAAANRQQRQALRQQRKKRLRSAAEYKTLVDDFKRQRAALLGQGGAADRAEFELRSTYASRHASLEEQQRAARKDLDLACQSDRELAIVEEDLLAYRGAENAEHIELLNLELEDLERDLQQTFEQLGSLKQELKACESDRTVSRLTWEREQLATAIERAATQWFALETAAHVAEDMQADFERTCQPAALADASRYLARLTCGKYRNIWTPLGQRQLHIDDEEQRSTLVENLSSGTREQLFLAIRLAMIEEFARKGVKLPLVLDDIIVNFDQRRGEAAAEVLLDFAQKGHQVLFFTCHLHLAHLFQSHGVEPVFLPSQAVTNQNTPAELLAG